MSLISADSYAVDSKFFARHEKGSFHAAGARRAAEIPLRLRAAVWD